MLIYIVVFILFVLLIILGGIGVPIINPKMKRGYIYHAVAIRIQWN